MSLQEQHRQRRGWSSEAPHHQDIRIGQLTPTCRLLFYPPEPWTFQRAGFSLVRFLWCILRWRNNSSERVNFWWQSYQRQVNRFSPDREDDEKEQDKKMLVLDQIQPLVLEGKQKVSALVLPVWIWVCVLRWSDRENFFSQILHWNGFTPVQKGVITSSVNHP